MKLGLVGLCDAAVEAGMLRLLLMMMAAVSDRELVSVGYYQGGGRQ
jgi:hypothetical protein